MVQAERYDALLSLSTVFAREIPTSDRDDFPTRRTIECMFRFRKVHTLLLESQLTPVTTTDRLVLRRILLTDTARDHALDAVEVQTEEEWHRNALLASPVIHAMHSRLESIVRKPHEEVANIDYDRVRNRHGLDPLVRITWYSTRLEDLQSAVLVLPEQGE